MDRSDGQARVTSAGPASHGSADAVVRAAALPRWTVALVGNPNTGKTTLFNALAGMRQRVGNYPGVTVETKKGQLKHRGQIYEVVDLPGTYSLAARSPDEMVAVDLILGQQPGEPRPNAVVCIVDASNLERNLYVTTQLMELDVPVVVALNMIDLAERQGLCIDAERLGKQLGLRVVPIQANKRRGLEQLKDAVAAAVHEGPPTRRVGFPEALEQEVAKLHEAAGRSVAPFLLRRLLFDVGGYAESRLAVPGGALARQLSPSRQRLAAAGCPVPTFEARARYAWIREATAGCIERPHQRAVTWTDRLDHVLTHPIWGTVAFLLLMFLVFEALFIWARPAMDLIGGGTDALAKLLRASLPAGPLSSLLIDGIIGGVGSVLVFLPQIIILFGFIAVLEDCGYMARAAFLMDRLMARCGLSGKSFIPLLSSVACAVPGIMAARVIENRRDRLATILVAPLMSCSARLPVYTLLIGAFLTDGFPAWLPGVVLFAMYAVGFVTAPLIALLLKRSVLRGETPVFVMEMPLYKWPAWLTVLRRMVDSGWAFLRRAGTLILAAMIVVWALLYFPRDDGRGSMYDLQLAALQDDREQRQAQAEAALGPAREALERDVETLQERADQQYGEWKRASYLGRMGRALEPIVRPLGWDWKIGMATLASFPAREVVVGTLGIIYNQGRVDTQEISTAEHPGQTRLGRALRDATWDDDPGRRVFTVPVALSLMVFFALCCQCVSTLAIMRRETNSWRWPVFTFVYMTLLAYAGALVVYQVSSWIT